MWPWQETKEEMWPCQEEWHGHYKWKSGGDWKRQRTGWVAVEGWADKERDCQDRVAVEVAEVAERVDEGGVS